MPSHTASLPPLPQFDVTAQIGLDDIGNSGHSYRETAEKAIDLTTVVDVIAGQFNNPVRVIDVSDHIACRSRKNISRLAAQRCHRKAHRADCQRYRNRNEKWSAVCGGHIGCRPEPVSGSRFSQAGVVLPLES